MSYQKQNFANGEVLTAPQLNHIEDGIVDVESAANATKAVVDNIIDPTLSLSSKAADAKITGDEIGQLKEDLVCLEDMTISENLFSDWKNGTWNRGDTPLFTPTWINRNDRISFGSLLFVKNGDSMRIESFIGQKYAIAQWTKDGDVYKNITYSDWYTETQALKFTVDNYISVVCAMENDTSPINTSNLGIKVYTIAEKAKLVKYVENNRHDIDMILDSPKEIFESEILDTISKVQSLQTEPCLVFPKITDIHYAPTSSVLQNFDDTIKILKRIVDSVHCDFVLNLGDNINGSSNQATMLSDARYVLNAFRSIGIPYVFCLGNHDTNYDPSPKFNIEQTYGAFYSATPKNVKINKNSNGTDFYIDYNDLGIRIVSLNGNYLNSLFIDDASANWFNSVALDTDNIVLLCVHESPINTQNWAAKTVYNGEWLKNKINLFIENGGTIIQLFGHSHADYAFTTPWLSIASTCCKFEQADITTTQYQAIIGYDGQIVAPTRTQGDVTEQAFDIVVIRPISRKINLVRFGSGSDREFTY